MQPAELVQLLDRASAADADPGDLLRARREVDALFAAHEARLYGLCRRYVRDPERARELAQDTMLTAYRKLGEWRGEGSFWAWLYGIARFKCLRANERKKDVLTHDGVLEASDPAATALSAMRSHERAALFQAAAAAVLDPTEQEAVYLRYVEGMPQEQITDVLALTGASGARGVLQRCRRKLGRELARRLAELGHGPSFFAESHT